MDFAKEKNVAVSVAKEASKVLLKYFGRKNSASQKPNKTLVGIADLEANRAIISVIRKSFPKHSIISEEGGGSNVKSDYKWLIDPLDGTHNFLHKIPIFGTSIALEYKNQVVVGVICLPILKLMAVAEKGKGAFLNGKRMKVSSRKNIKHSFFAFEFSYSGRRQKAHTLQKFNNKPIDLRNFGAAVYSLVLVASGNIDGYIIMSTNEWDIAAGFLMIEEAGGKITGLKGNKWNFNEKRYIASNRKLHKALLKLLK